MSNEKRTSGIRRFSWLTGQLVVAALLVVFCATAGKKVVMNAIDKGKTLYIHYLRKNDAEKWPDEKKTFVKEIRQLDSLLGQLDLRQMQAGGTLVDEIYAYAADAGFRTKKVEAGIPQKIGSRTETSVTIEGTGQYSALGGLVEKIENNRQSTRIRQLTMEKKDDGDPEIFIDVVVREENGTAENGRQEQ